MSEKELTPKQQLFCEAYLSNGFNGTQAAITAGYSQDNAKQQAVENLSKPYIRLFIDKSVDNMLANKKELTKQLIDEMKKYAFMSDSQMELLQVRPSDKRGYVEMLCKYLTLFTEKKEVNHTTLDEDGKKTGINTKNITEDQAKEMFLKLRNEG